MRGQTPPPLPPGLHKRTSSLPILPVEPLKIHKQQQSSSAITEPVTPVSLVSWPESPASSVLTSKIPREWQRIKLRHNCIRELYGTERQFCQDMSIVVKMYMCSGADVALAPNVVETLFSNVTEILDVSLSLVAMIEKEVGHYILQGPNDIFSDMAADAEVHIGRAMANFFTSDLYEVYERYTHENPAQMDTCFKLSGTKTHAPPPQEAKWLAQCTRKAANFTTAWSLDALLIKPVQRLGKYPLFLQNLLEATDPAHSDYHDIETALRRSKLYIECINARFGCNSP